LRCNLTGIAKGVVLSALLSALSVLSDPYLDPQSRTVSSPDAEARRLLSGEKATLFTQCVCPSRVRRSFSSDTLHSLTVLSRDPEARRLPSGEKATLFTQSVCPSRVRRSFPSDTLQSRTVLSRDPEARRLPSGEKATLLT
jgi:hypothetical protein